MSTRISVCSLIFCMCANAMVKAVDIQFDVNDVSHHFSGFGAQIWHGDMRVESILTSLNMKYVRMKFGGNWNPPTDATQAQMDSYVASQYDDNTAIRNTYTMLNQHGIAVIGNFFEGPSVWLGSGNLLKTENFDDIARLWASIVYYMQDHNMPISYIEMFNEPEGNWNIRVPGPNYNTVVKLVRAELDSRGLTNVGIAGPGLAVLKNGPTWISALDNDGKAALACWSTHAWDEGWDDTEALPSFLDQRWQDYFGAAVDSADPCHSKPIIVTEYATGVRTYNGVTFDQNEVTDSNQFAQRCYENFLTLVNNGASVLCYWEAANQSWQTSAPWYGLMRTDSSLRNVYSALSTLAPYMPDNAMVIRKTWDDPNISAAGFVDANQLVLAFANSTDSSVNRTVGLTGVTSFAVTIAQAFESGSVVNKLSQISFDYDSNSMEVNLAPESTLTVVGIVNECTIKQMGDLDGDCCTTLGDYSMVAADWLEDNYVVEIEVIEDFESYTDDSWLQAAWVMNPSSDITEEILVNDPCVLNGSNCMLITNTAQGPAYYTQTKFALPGAVHNVHGVNLTYQGHDTISMTFAIPPNGSTPPWENLGGTGGDAFLSMFDCWGMKVFNASYPGDVTPSGTGWPKGIVWELNFATYTVDGQNLENVEHVTVGYNQEYYGAGAMFVDDIIVYDSSSLVCSEEPAGDVNQDCVVNFDDILVLSENWLKCILIEQSQCW